MLKILKIFFVLSVIIGIFSCSKKDLSILDDTNGSTITSDTSSYNADWTFESHGNSDPDYNRIFPQESVNKIEITMTSDQWKSIRTNMKSLFGYDFGSGMGGQPGEFANSETDYIDVLMKFEGKVWKNVGFRLKGNSSLALAWGSGNYKLPFRLNFDKFEDKYQGIKNQHFYGFEELSFSPAFKDQSLIREKLTAEVFRKAGIAASQTAFYRIYIDFGSGLKYCGVYTVVELPDDNMIKDQFGEESGNIYKPESKLESYIESQFEKKNNISEAEFRDVQEFVNALNSSLRTSNAEEWRKNIESTFNVDHFLKYLAINNTIVNWDSYGIMAHNYYLYNHSSEKLTWIPWDHNEAFTGSPGITGTISQGSPGPGSNSGLSLKMNEVTNSWPLIKYLVDDPIYFDKYKNYLKWFNDQIFVQEEMDQLIDKYYSLISQYAIGSEGEQKYYTYLTSSSSFTSAKNTLKTHIASRKTLVSSFTQ